MVGPDELANTLANMLPEHSSDESTMVGTDQEEDTLEDEMEHLFNSNFGPVQVKHETRQDYSKHPVKPPDSFESDAQQQQNFHEEHEFQDMCHGKGIGIHPHLAVRRSGPTGFGLYATKPLERHATIATFAPGAYLSGSAFRKSPSGEHAHKLLLQAGWVKTNEQLLWMAVASERAKHNESSWAPYLNMLSSKEFNLPRNWESQALKKLQDTSVYDQLIDDWALISNFTTAVCPSSGPLCNHISWAIDVVWSRGVPIRDDYYLFPCYDFANHAANQRVPHFSEEQPRGISESTIRITSAASQTRAGRELFVSYGHRLNNGDLLRRYGFVLDRNPHERVHITMNILKLASEVGYRGLTHGEEHALKILGSKFVLKINSPPQKLITALRVYTCKEQELTCSQDYTRALDDEHELHVWGMAYAIMHRLWMRLAYLRCSTRESNMQIRVASAYRRSQRRVLRYVIKVCNKRISSLAWRLSKKNKPTQ